MQRGRCSCEYGAAIHQAKGRFWRMHTLSVCMIVKNEEEVLSRCLASAVQFSDEVVVVDTGSVDKTKEIARQYTEKVYDFAWQDDFAQARNFAFSKGTCDYLMWLDADDVVTPETSSASGN